MLYIAAVYSRMEASISIERVPSLYELYIAVVYNRYIYFEGELVMFIRVTCCIWQLHTIGGGLHSDRKCVMSTCAVYSSCTVYSRKEASSLIESQPSLCVVYSSCIQ